MKENYMRILNPRSWLFVFFAALLVLTPEVASAQMKHAAAGTVTFTVTVVPKKDASSSVSKDDVQLFLGKERKQVGDWRQDEHLYLAILIDDSIDSSAASNWNDLRSFIMAQPPTTLIAVGYIQNNGTRLAQDFTDNHELAA